MKILRLFIPVVLGATLVSACPQTCFAQDKVIAQAQQLRDESKYPEAKKLLIDAQKALQTKIAEEKDAAEKTVLQNSLADVYFQLGETLVAVADSESNWGQAEKVAPFYKEALAQYSKAYEIDKTARRPEAAKDLMQIAEMYDELGDNSKASASLELAVAIYQERKDQLSEAIALGRLARVYQKNKLTPSAIDLMKRALALWAELKDERQHKNTIVEIGHLYASQGQYETAIGYYERALAVNLEGERRVKEGSLLFSIGTAYSKLKQPQKAIEYYERSWPVFAAIKYDEETVTILFELMALYTANKQPALAIARGEQAVNVMKAGFENAREKDSQASRAIANEILLEQRAKIVDLAALLAANGRDADAKALLEWQGNP